MAFPLCGAEGWSNARLCSSSAGTWAAWLLDATSSMRSQCSHAHSSYLLGYIFLFYLERYVWGSSFKLYWNHFEIRDHYNLSPALWLIFLQSQDLLSLPGLAHCMRFSSLGASSVVLLVFFGLHGAVDFSVLWEFTVNFMACLFHLPEVPSWSGWPMHYLCSATMKPGLSGSAEGCKEQAKNLNRVLGTG